MGKRFLAELNAEKALIFRITHRDNIGWAIENGLHCRKALKCDPKFVSIGNQELIDKRHVQFVPEAPGGTLSDYVPFYFTPLSMMAYNIHTGHAGIRKRHGSEIVIIVSSVRLLAQNAVPFLFTDRHASLAGARFMNDLDGLDRIDWKILQNRDFQRNNDDIGKTDRYQAEALVYKVLPAESWLGLACYDENQLKQMQNAVRGVKPDLTVALKERMVLLMLTFTVGNLLDAKAEALVNTVNTVGVMGKGIALMFKDAFPDNYRAYVAACKKKQVNVGRVFVTERQDWAGGPRWIVNFPTKKHWLHPSKLEWIKEGLVDLKRFIIDNKVQSIALPPLGSGNGGLAWSDVKNIIQMELSSVPDTTIIVYEPTSRYQNIAKREGVQKLTPARALIAELVRRYSVLGFECTILEVQKLVYFLQRKIDRHSVVNPLNLQFEANKFGPYAPVLGHVLNGLDGSYLHCEKRVADAGPMDIIWFEDMKKDVVSTYISTEAKRYLPALKETTALIDRFESPLGLEVLGTVDWLLQHDKVEPSLPAVKHALKSWLGGGAAADRKVRLFEDQLIEVALDRLKPPLTAPSEAPRNEERP